MSPKKISFLLSLSILGYSSLSIADSALVNIDCELATKQENAKFHMYPQIYIKENKLCFNVTNWTEYKGQNCLDAQGNAQWEAVVLLAPGGNSIGRDDTQFRVRNAEFTPERIKYLVEWGRDNTWHPLQNLDIDRVTGQAVEWAIGEHGGSSLVCKGRGPAF